MEFITLATDWNKADAFDKYKPIKFKSKWTRSVLGLYGITPEGTTLLLVGNWWALDPVLLEFVNCHVEAGGKAVFGTESCLIFAKNYIYNLENISK